MLAVPKQEKWSKLKIPVFVFSKQIQEFFTLLPFCRKQTDQSFSLHRFLYF